MDEESFEHNVDAAAEWEADYLEDAAQNEVRQRGPFADGDIPPTLPLSFLDGDMSCEGDVSEVDSSSAGRAILRTPTRASHSSAFTSTPTSTPGLLEFLSPSPINSGPEHAASAGQRVVRRRLRFKQKVDSSVYRGNQHATSAHSALGGSSEAPRVSQASDEHLPKATFPSRPDWVRMPRRDQHRAVWNAIRDWWCQKSCPGSSSDGTRGSSGHQNADRKPKSMGVLRGEFILLSKTEKFALAGKWLREAQPPKHVAALLDSCFIQADEAGSKYRYTSVLLTYMGPWEEIVDLSEHVWGSHMSVDDVASELQQRPSLKVFWRTLLTQVEKIQNHIRAQDVACSLEMCPRLFDAERRARIHLHVYFRSESRLPLLETDHLRVSESRPHIASVVGGLTFSKGRNTWAGFFYCTVPKLGQLFMYATREAYKDFLVQGQWILSLLQSQKISVAVARTLLQKTCNSFVRWEKEMLAVEGAVGKESIERKLHEARRASEDQQRPCKEFP